MLSGWTRTERIALYSLLVAIAGVSITLLTVQEFRRFLGLPDSSRPAPQVVSGSPVQHETRESPAGRPRPEPALRKRFDVPANKIWAETGIPLVKGARLSISASGQWSDGGQPFRYWGPNGTGNPWPGTILPSANLDALIGKVGDVTFLIGDHYSGSSPASGKLFLSMNDAPDSFSDNVGTMSVEIEYDQR